MPHPIISGLPANALNDGDSVNLTCTWPRLSDAATLNFVHPVSKELLSQTDESDPNKLVTYYTVTAESKKLNIHRCEVGGVKGRNDTTLADSVALKVIGNTTVPGSYSNNVIGLQLLQFNRTIPVTI